MPVKDEIERLAYLMWEREGRPQGAHLRHYFEAEKILLERERGEQKQNPTAAQTAQSADGATPARRPMVRQPASPARTSPARRSTSSARPPKRKPS